MEVLSVKLREIGEQGQEERWKAQPGPGALRIHGQEPEKPVLLTCPGRSQKQKQWPQVFVLLLNPEGLGEESCQPVFSLMQRPAWIPPPR